MFARHHFEEYGSVHFGDAEEDHGVIPQPHLLKNQQLLEFEFEQEALHEIHDIMLNGDEDLVLLALIASTLIVSSMFFRAWYFMLEGSNYVGITVDCIGFFLSFTFWCQEFNSLAVASHRRRSISCPKCMSLAQCIPWVEDLKLKTRSILYCVLGCILIFHFEILRARIIIIFQFFHHF